MEQRIREQAELLDHARDAICLRTCTRTSYTGTRAPKRLYGWSSREALGKNANELLFQDDLHAPTEALRNLIRNSEWMGELHQVTKDGKNIIVESRWTLMKDSEGKPQSILVINTDITEKKQIEAQFLRTQRLEGIGALAGGIAHDLNNALAPVLIGIELIRPDLDNKEGRRHLELMVAGTRRAVDMVRQILTFSRGVSGRHESLTIRPLIEEIAVLASKTFPRSIQIEVRTAERLPSVVGNSTQLHQVLLNLCVNARDAMPKGGKLIIEAEAVELEAINLPRIPVESRHLRAHYRLGHRPWHPARNPEKNLRTLFHHQGIGEGEWSWTFHRHGHRQDPRRFLDVSSHPGKGTTFKIYLPAKPQRNRKNLTRFAPAKLIPRTTRSPLSPPAAPATTPVSSSHFRPW